jgi:endonuclease-8
MPEGDSIHNAAMRLRPALEGHRLVRFEAPRAHGSMPRTGATITAVEAVGKHLLVRFDDGFVLETHLRMTGRWDLYRRGERWRKGAHLARAVIETDEHVAVCFSAPVVRVHRAAPDGASPSLRSAIGHLGPDLCRADADLTVALGRLQDVVDPETLIVDALLDQRVAAGIGNVFKSEVLWACRVAPTTRVGALDAARRRQLLETAARQLQANLGPASGRRTTVSGPPGSLAVYRRARRPCRRCGTPIRFATMGVSNRGTYWCPRCQPDPSDQPGQVDPGDPVDPVDPADPSDPG